MEESSGDIGGRLRGTTRGARDRLRGAARGARDRIAGTADTITGIQSRRQWEAFTDAVTRTVIGVHRDLEELRKTQGELETQHETLRQEFDAMHSEGNPHSARSPDSHRLWFAVLGVGAVSAVALILGIIVLWRSF